MSHYWELLFYTKLPIRQNIFQIVDASLTEIDSNVRL